MFTFGDPGIGGSSSVGSGDLATILSLPGTWSNPTPSDQGGGPSNPSGSWLSQLLPWANLGAQTFLADQAITSPRPSTVTLLPNGQVQATGGGAAPIAASFGAVPSWVWIIALLLVVVMLFKR